MNTIMYNNNINNSKNSKSSHNKKNNNSNNSRENYNKNDNNNDNTTRGFRNRTRPPSGDGSAPTPPIDPQPGHFIIALRQMIPSSL